MCAYLNIQARVDIEHIVMHKPSNNKININIKCFYLNIGLTKIIAKTVGYSTYT